MNREDFYDTRARLGTVLAANIAEFLGVPRAQVQLWILTRKGVEHGKENR